jgi:hypothetical protein
MTKSITIELEDQDYALLYDLAGENLSNAAEFAATLVQNELAVWRDDIRQARERQEITDTLDEATRIMLEELMDSLGEKAKHWKVI